MPIRHISTTLLQNYPQCPSRAMHSYAGRLENGDDNEGTDSTRFGTVVHNTMERMHEAGMVTSVDVTDESILMIFDEEWQKGTCYDFSVYAFGREKIADFVRRSFFSRTGETIATELLFVLEVETDKIWIIEDSMIVGPSYVVGEIIKRGNTPVVSKIDRIDKFVRPDGKIKISFFDYKTNILPFSRDDIENSKQLGVYDIVVRAIFPEASEFEGVYDMLRHGRFPVTFSEQSRTDLKQYLINLWKQIDTAQCYEERINKYCRWCEIRGKCAAYKLVLESNVPQVLTDALDTPEAIDQLFEQYDKLGDIVKIAKERQGEVRDMIGSKIVKDNFGEPLTMGDKEYYLQQNPRYEYDKRGVFKTLEQLKSLTLLPDIISISKTAIERAFKSKPDVKAALDQHVRKNFVTPTLKRRILKGNATSNTDESDAD